MYIKDLYKSTLIPVLGTDLIDNTLNDMKTNGISILPVVDSDNIYMGLIDYSADIDQNKNKNIQNSSIITFKDIYAFPHQHILEILDLFFKNNILSIPVIDKDSKYLGIITYQSVIEWLSTITSIKTPGAIVVISLDYRDYMLSEISQIIENNNSKILFLYIELDQNSTHAELTIKLNNNEITSIIQTLERYNYTIKSYFADVQLLTDLYKERVEELLNYINI